MAFSSSDSPEDGLGAGDGVSGRAATAGSAEELLRAAEEEGEDGKCMPTDDSASAEVIRVVGRWLGVEGDSF